MESVRMSSAAEKRVNNGIKVSPAGGVEDALSREVIQMGSCYETPWRSQACSPGDTHINHAVRLLETSLIRSHPKTPGGMKHERNLQSLLEWWSNNPDQLLNFHFNISFNGRWNSSSPQIYASEMEILGR